MSPRSRLFASVAAALLAATPGGAQTLRTAQAPVELTVGVGAWSDEVTQLQLEAEPRLEFDLSPTSGVVLSARLRLDGEDRLEPQTPALDSYAPASRPATIAGSGTLELRDAYWETRFGRGIARFGKQQIVWGRLDGVKVLDVVNPQSFREFILDDFGDSRISLWAAYLDLFAAGWRLEAALLPDYTAHEIPEPGAWFELTAPRFRFGAATDDAALPAVTDPGRRALNHGALGLRLSRTLGRFDVSALAYSGNDHEPLGRVIGTGQGPVIERFHRRREVFGASAATSFGAVALRVEAALQPARAFNTRDATGLRTTRADQVSAGIAADVDGPLGLFVNLQFLWDEVLEAPAALLRPARDRSATVFLRRSFAYETTRVEARWYHSFSEGDDLLKLTLEHEVADDTAIYLSGDWFDGTRKGLFGQFAARDRIVLGLRHTF